MINLIIWGIRDGFEERLFNLNEVHPDFHGVPRDALFRSLSNKVRPSAYFMISRTRNLNVFTIIHTEITEYNPTAQRPGFVAFSYVLDKNAFFAESPMNVFKSFVDFYIARVGEGKTNNFTREEAAQFVAQLKLENRLVALQDEKCFGYFNTTAEIDELFVGSTSYATYSELILFPERADASIAELFKERGGGYKLINLGSERTKEHERKHWAKLAEQEERSIYDIFVNGDKVQAYQTYVNSPYKDYFSESFSRVLNEFNRELNDCKRQEFDREETLRIENEIVSAVKRKDIETAIHLYNSVQHRNYLQRSTSDSITPYLRERHRVEEEKRAKDRERKNREKEKRKNRKILILASSIGVLISLGMIGFFLKIPAGLYTETLVPVVDTIESVRDKKIDEISVVDTTPSLTQSERLLRGDTLFAGRFQDNQKLDSSFVFYNTNNDEWKYSKDMNKPFAPVDKPKSIAQLIERFNFSSKTKSQSEDQPNSSGSEYHSKTDSKNGSAKTTHTPTNPTQSKVSGNGQKELDDLNKQSLTAEKPKLPDKVKVELDTSYDELLIKKNITQEEFNTYSSKVNFYKIKGYDMSPYEGNLNVLKKKIPKND